MDEVSMHSLAILTPSYNRADRLPALYASLLAQKDRNFVWIIADDGSTDGTKELVEGWIREQADRGEEPRIRYLHKENGGKHTALNMAIRGITEELCFIVDSDDRLTEDAVEVIRRYAAEWADRKGPLALCGFSFLKVDSRGEVNTRAYERDEIVGSYRDERINKSLFGDKAEVFYTEILKAHPFKEFPGERFMPEDALWMVISGPHPLVHANRPIYVYDYLEGGLTKSGRRMKIHSPLGMMHRSSVYLNDGGVKWSVRAKMMLLYRIYEKFALRTGDATLRQERRGLIARDCAVKRGLFYHIFAIPAELLYLQWKKKYC